MVKSIRIGTDCSGMEAPIQAIRNLKVKYEHKFSCDVNPYARATIEANFPHETMYHDLTKRDNTKAPDVDVYIAGFPCQPFSSAGQMQGFKDKRGRGKIFFDVVDFIARRKPRVFILENVSRLVHLQGGKYMKAILQELDDLKKYNVKWQVLDTKENGIPQSRKRWYCVGILKEFDDDSFEFPTPIQCPPIELLLECRDAKQAADGLPPASATTAVGNVKRVVRELQAKGEDPRSKGSYLCDIDSSGYRASLQNGVSPCLTVARSKGHWIFNRGRRQSKEEMMRLQGMDPTSFTVAVTQSQLGQQLGNTMSVNVLERVFARLLPAAKLVKHGDVKDRWETGQAVKKLSLTRGKGFKANISGEPKMITKGFRAKSADDAPAAKRQRVSLILD